MLKSAIVYSFLVTSLSTTFLHAMDAEGTSMRRVSSVDTPYAKPDKPHGNHTKITKSDAVKLLFPDDIDIQSRYITDDTSKEQFVSSLQTLRWIRTKEVTVQQDSKNSTVTHTVDASSLDTLYQREVIEKERPAIVKATREDEQKKLSIVQRNPKSALFLAMLVGASLPYAIPLLLEKYQLLDK